MSKTILNKNFSLKRNILNTNLDPPDPDPTKQDKITPSNRLNADLISNGVVSNTEFDRLNGVSSDILEADDIGVSVQGFITNGTTSQYYRGDKSFVTLNKNDVGLSNIDNTSDADKPVSNAVQTELNAKENTITATNSTQYYRGDKSFQTLDKTVVGLPNVDNTSDIAKPVSNAVQTELNAKEPIITATNSTQYYRGDKSFQTLDKTVVGLPNVDNTSDIAKPVSNAVQTLLNAKQFLITDSSNLIMNYCETETNLVLRVKSNNNTDLANAIVFQNTGSFYNIALTRRYGSGVTNNRSNFCIQTGAGSSISSLPIRMCVQSNGNVNIGSSQSKSTFFNVEGDSNFEGHCNLTSNKLYKINGLQIDSNDILYDNSGTELLKTKIDSKEPNISSGTTSQYYRGDKSFQTLDKNAVGLSNVDNTTDLNKPVSNDTQTAINGKENTVTSGTTSQYYRGDKSFQTLNKNAVGLSNVDNTTDLNKPVSNDTQTAINGKENTVTSGTTSQYYRGDKSFQTLDKNAVGLNNVANIGVSTLGGINLTYNTTSNKLDVDTTLTSMSKISSSSGNFEIASENQIKFYSDENGDNGGGDFVWQTSKTSGGLAQQLMRITGSTGNVVMNGESLTLNNLL